MLEHCPALEHLRATDPALAKVIERVGDCTFTARSDGTHFDALVRAIVYQQLSGKAAATIHRRFQELYGGRPPTPAEVLATDDERMRAVGLSRQKLGYIKDLAAKVHTGDVPTDSLDTLPDDEIISALVRVKGIGRWSAQMFLMFRLGRPNVLPDLDLGVQTGIQHAYGLKSLPKPKDVLRIGERWAPYASIASWYMWRVLELPEVIRARSERRTAERRAGDRRAGAKKAPSTKKAAQTRKAARTRKTVRSKVAAKGVRKTTKTKRSRAAVRTSGSARKRKGARRKR